MIRALLDFLARVLADPAPAVDDVVDLVPVDCGVCGFPIDFCDCSPAERIPHDLSDYDDYIAADMKKCRNCGMKTAFLAGDVYVVRHLYDRARDPMCVACQALLSEPVAR